MSLQNWSDTLAFGWKMFANDCFVVVQLSVVDLDVGSEGRPAKGARRGVPDEGCPTRGK